MSRAWTLVVAAALAACDDSGGSGTDPDAPLDPEVDAPVGPMCSAPRAPLSGEATYYDADGSGNCSFPASSDHMVAAMNATDYMMASWCGACISVDGPMGSVVVRVVDKCPGCGHGDVDLSREAFAAISPLSAGRIAITWREVACDVTGPVRYEFKVGSSAFYAAIQLRNHRYPIAKLEAQVSGTYQTIPRVEYNYFVKSGGLGAGPFTLRVTDTRGHVLEDTGVMLGDGVVRTGAAQFPVCP